MEVRKHYKNMCPRHIMVDNAHCHARYKLTTSIVMVYITLIKYFNETALKKKDTEQCKGLY